MRPGRSGRACLLTFSRALREGSDVRVGQVPGEVSVDAVSVVEAGALHRLGALLGQEDEDRAPVVLGADAADEPSLLHAVDDPGEAALAVEDPLGQLVHGEAVRRLLELDEDVVPALWDAHRLLELGIEHVDQRQRALEEEPPAAESLGRGA